MNTKVAINGLGRIRRAVLKLVFDEPSIALVAVNDLVDVVLLDNELHSLRAIEDSSILLTILLPGFERETRGNMNATCIETQTS